MSVRSSRRRVDRRRSVTKGSGQEGRGHEACEGIRLQFSQITEREADVGRAERRAWREHLLHAVGHLGEPRRSHGMARHHDRGEVREGFQHFAGFTQPVVSPDDDRTDRLPL